MTQGRWVAVVVLVVILAAAATALAIRPADDPATPVTVSASEDPKGPTSAPQTTEPPPVEPPPVAVAYAVPVQPATAASWGADHHDYPATDIFADCGTTVVAPVTGTVHELTTEDRWDPEIDDPDTRGGLSIAIVGIDGVRHYMSHLGVFSLPLAPSDRVSVGQPIGTVGRSGNAAPTPCHVHYGLSPPRGPGDTLIRRGVIWPQPYLDAWAAGDPTHSPTAEISAWAAANP